MRGCVDCLSAAIDLPSLLPGSPIVPTLLSMNRLINWPKTIDWKKYQNSKGINQFFHKFFVCMTYLNIIHGVL